MIDRFKEREENVKVVWKLQCIAFFVIKWLSLNVVVLQIDVFNTFIELLRQTGNVTNGQVDINKLRQVDHCFGNYLKYLTICCEINKKSILHASVNDIFSFSGVIGL